MSTTKWKWLAFIIVVITGCVLIFYKSNKAGDVYVLKDGKQLVVTPIKHASIQMNYDGMEIEIDPVSSASRPIVDYTDKPKADFILITNDHEDHFDTYAVGLLVKPSTNILLPSRCFRRLNETALRNNCVIMRNDYKADLGKGVTVYAVPAYNITPDKREYAPKTRYNGYVIDFNGFRVYISGDTEFIHEMKQLKNIDIAFLAYDHYHSMNITQLARAVRQIRPRTLYPYQYGVAGLDSVKHVVQGLHIDLRIHYLQ